MERWLAVRGNARLKVGEVKEKDADSSRPKSSPRTIPWSSASSSIVTPAPSAATTARRRSRSIRSSLGPRGRCRAGSGGSLPRRLGPHIGDAHMLVAPGVPSGTPATMMTRWPALAKPSLKAMRQARSTMSSLVVRVLGDDAMHAPDQRQPAPGRDVGRQRHDRRPAAARARRASAVEPDEVQQTMAARSSVSAIWRAAAAMASAPVASGSARCAVDDGAVERRRSPPPRRCGSWSPPPRPDIGRPPIPPTASPRRRLRRSRSRRRRLRRGSAPATVIIDSSICVATTTGLPAARPARVICFCMPGTFSSGISTPRSPRATISASATSMISSSRCTACGFSILAITAARPRVIFLASAMSSGRCTKDSAIQSMPASSAASRSERSLAVERRERDRSVSGRLTPLRSDSLPPTSTRVTMRLRLGLGDGEPHLAVVEQQRVAGLDARRRFPDAADRRAWRRRAPDRSRARRCAPFVEHDRAAGEGADAQLRPLQIDQDADRPAVSLLDAADRRRPARACGRGWCGSC